MASISTPKLGHSPRSVGSAPGSSGGGGSVYGNGFTGQGTPKVGYTQQPSGHLADVPAGLFYPFFPEKATGGENGQSSGETPDSPGGAGAGIGQAGPGSAGGGGQGSYDSLLATAAATQPIPYGYHPSQENFMLEEKDPIAVIPGMQMWIHNTGAVSPVYASKVEVVY